MCLLGSDKKHVVRENIEIEIFNSWTLWKEKLCKSILIYLYYFAYQISVVTMNNFNVFKLYTKN